MQIDDIATFYIHYIVVKNRFHRSQELTTLRNNLKFYLQFNFNAWIYTHHSIFLIFPAIRPSTPS